MSLPSSLLTDSGEGHGKESKWGQNGAPKVGEGVLPCLLPFSSAEGSPWWPWWGGCQPLNAPSAKSGGQAS